MDGPLRVIIWTTPRTCGTALLKSLSSLPDTKIFNELYTVGGLFGPDRFRTGDPLRAQEQDFDQSQTDDSFVFPSSICTYEWIKQILEGDYPGKRIIISKEIALYANCKLDCLPQGYRHVFLLRHPSKIFPSWKKFCYELMTDANVLNVQSGGPPTLKEFPFDKMPPEHCPTWMCLKAVYDVYEYVREKKLDENPVIIEAEDLVQNPAAVMTTLCAQLGLPYSDSLLTWDEGYDTVGKWTLGIKMMHLIKYSKGFENFRNSTSFNRQAIGNQAAESTAEVKVTPDIKFCVDYSLPFYLKMYEQRLQVANAS